MKFQSISHSYYYLLFFILVALLYGNTINHEFVLDDAIVLSENSFVIEGFEGIPKILTNESMVGFYGEQKSLVAGGRYRPLSLISFAIEKQFFGLNPMGFHLFNIFFYFLNIILIFKILKLIFKDYFSSERRILFILISTLLFIVHPIHTEVVANIKSRDEILAFIGSLSSLYFALKYVDTKKILNIIASVICLFLALLSKESAITFLAIIPLTIYFFRKDSNRNNLLIFSSLLGVSLLWLFIRQQIIGSFAIDSVADNLMNDPFLNTSISEKNATIIYTLWKYISLSFFPHPLTFDYYPKHIPILNFSDYRVIGSLIFCLSLIVFSIYGLIKRNIYAFGILFFGITLSISSNIVFPIGVFMSERFIYMSSFGFCLIAAYWLVFNSKILFNSYKIHRQIITGFTALILIAFSVKTISRNTAWKSNLTLAVTDAKTSINGAKSQTMAGGQLIEMAQKTSDENLRNSYLSQAITYLDRAIQIYPEYIDPKLLMGNAQWEYNQNYQQALMYYFDILKINSNHKNAHQNIQYVIENINSTEEKIAAYKSYLPYSNHPSQINFKIGNLYGQQLGNFTEAINYLKLAYRQNETDINISINLGTAYALNQQYNNSIEVLESTLKLAPNNYQIYINLGLAYFEIGDNEAAKISFDKAVQLNQELDRSQFPI